MKKTISYLQHYLLTGVLLLGSFGAVPTHLSQSSTLLTADQTTQEGSLTQSSESTDEEIYAFESNLIIKAFNPGYTDEINYEVGEFIELYNLTNAPLALAGYQLVYTGSGKPNTIFTFPEESFLTGKHLLLRFDKTPEKDFDISYKMGKYGMSQENGKLELLYNGVKEPVDQVCWTITKDPGQCIQRPKDKGETIVRNLKQGTFEKITPTEYETPTIDPDYPNLILPSASDVEEPPKVDDELPASQCLGLEFSELLTYYTEDKTEQFIELFNPMDEKIVLDGCKISFKNKLYTLTGEVPSGGYYAYHQSAQFALTKNPTNPLALTLIDVNGEVLDEIAYTKGQKSLTSLAKFIDADGEESWRITYAITPGQENIYQKFRNCEEGKIINEATGNCIKAPESDDEEEEEKAEPAEKTLAPCPAGKYRNPLTGRCKNIETTTTATLAPCPAGKYRNPLTGRCKNIETTSSTSKECAEGYERNPETNRCRKIKTTSSNDGADYALTPTVKSDKTAFVGLGIVVMIVLIGLVYVILQFRREILRAARKARQRINHIGQNLFTRKIGRDRNQKS